MTKGKIVYLDKLPHCGICAVSSLSSRTPQTRVDAKYDGKTIYGYWANMCGDCFRIYGLGKTGMGYAQELRIKEEK